MGHHLQKPINKGQENQGEYNHGIPQQKGMDISGQYDHRTQNHWSQYFRKMLQVYYTCFKEYNCRYTNTTYTI